MKKKYTILFILAIAAVCAGCTKSTVTENTEEADVITQEETEEETEEVTTEETENTEADSEKENASQGEGGEIAGEWTDMQIRFEGKDYTIPFAYKDLEAEGWSFNLSDYGYEDGYVLNPEDSVSGTIHLEKDAFDPYEVDVSVGFVNNSDSAKDITECDIWSFTVNVWQGYEPAKSYPSLEIAKGIGIGSSLEEVEAAFGKTEEFSEDTENDCVYLEYAVDFTYYLRLTVHNQYGITSLEIVKH